MNRFIAALLSFAVALPLLMSTSGTVLAEDGVQEEDNALAVVVRDTDPLIGAWLVDLTNKNTNMVSPALYSFLPGGVLHQSDTPLSDPMLNNLAFSNAHGAWEYDAEQESYNIRYFKLSYRADASYDGKEETVGMLKLSEEGKLSGFISIGNVESVFTGERITATRAKP